MNPALPLATVEVCEHASISSSHIVLAVVSLDRDQVEQRREFLVRVDRLEITIAGLRPPMDHACELSHPRGKLGGLVADIV